MTNEQLRIMLNLISGMVSKVAKEIEPLIVEGEREKVRTWIGEGEEPRFDFGHDSASWDYVDGEEFVAVKLVNDLAFDVNEMAESLGS